MLFPGQSKCSTAQCTEDALEGHGLGQADGTVLLRVAKRQQRRAQERRVPQVRMVIWKSAELDHGAMLPQQVSQGQSAIMWPVGGGLVKR